MSIAASSLGSLFEQAFPLAISTRFLVLIHFACYWLMHTVGQQCSSAQLISHYIKYQT